MPSLGISFSSLGQRRRRGGPDRQQTTTPFGWALLLSSSSPFPSLTMVPLFLSLAALSCLGFAGAEPFHIPLVRRHNPLSVEEYAAAADALRSKYHFTHTPNSKRQNTAAIPIINQVCPEPSLSLS